MLSSICSCFQKGVGQEQWTLIQEIELPVTFFHVGNHIPQHEAVNASLLAGTESSPDGICVTSLCLSLQVSVYAVPDKIDQAEYALDAAVTLLEFYEDYFSIPYPLPKQGRDFAQLLQIVAFNDPSHKLYAPNYHPCSYPTSPSQVIKTWQVLTIGLIWSH